MIGQVGAEVYAFWDSTGWPDWRQSVIWHSEKSEDEVRGVQSLLDSHFERSPDLHFIVIPYRRVVFV